MCPLTRRAGVLKLGVLLALFSRPYVYLLRFLSIHNGSNVSFRYYHCPGPYTHPLCCPLHDFVQDMTYVFIPSHAYAITLLPQDEPIRFRTCLAQR